MTKNDAEQFVDVEFLENDDFLWKISFTPITSKIKNLSFISSVGIRNYDERWLKRRARNIAKVMNWTINRWDLESGAELWLSEWEHKIVKAIGDCWSPLSYLNPQVPPVNRLSVINRLLYRKILRRQKYNGVYHYRISEEYRYMMSRL